MMANGSSDFVSKCWDLEDDRWPNGKTVQFFKNWFDVISSACACHQPSKTVLDTLQFVQV